MQLILIVESLHKTQDGVDKVLVTQLIENDDSVDLHWKNLLAKFPNVKVEAVKTAPNRIALKMHLSLE